MTPSVTATADPETPTPTTTATPSTPCGNGDLDAGEACDDGGIADGDGCSATCESELVLGTNSKRVRRGDCLVEWLTVPVPAPGKHGLPGSVLVCSEGDPSCDFGAAGDGQCTFHVALCLNPSDARAVDPRTGAPACSTFGIDDMTIKTPADRFYRATVDGQNRAALELVLTGVGATSVGVCKGARAGNICADDADCDTSPGSFDGKCRARVLHFEPDLTSRDVCTAFAEIEVDLKPTSAGFRKGNEVLRLTTVPTYAPGATTRRNAKDLIQLICLPPN